MRPACGSFVALSCANQPESGSQDSPAPHSNIWKPEGASSLWPWHPRALSAVPVRTASVATVPSARPGFWGHGLVGETWRPLQASGRNFKKDREGTRGVCWWKCRQWRFRTSLPALPVPAGPGAGAVLLGRRLNSEAHIFLLNCSNSSEQQQDSFRLKNTRTPPTRGTGGPSEQARDGEGQASGASGDRGVFARKSVVGQSGAFWTECVWGVWRLLF